MSCQQKKTSPSPASNASSCCSSASASPAPSACCSTASKPSSSSCCSSNAEQTNSPNGNSQAKVVIHPEMTISEILSLFPNKAQKLSYAITSAGLHCVGCNAATWETLEVGMLSHGKTQNEISGLVKKLNALLDEAVDLSTISMTQRATVKFMHILAEEGKQGWGLRFSEEVAGCSGLEYILDYSEKADADDEIFMSHGIEIHVKKALVKRLMGSEIDYIDGLQGSGFKISNPNARSSCGCGSSHNY